MLFSGWHLRFLVLLTAGPHPFEIEKHCSKADRTFDYKTKVAIRQWVSPPVRKRKEKIFLLQANISTVSAHTTRKHHLRFTQLVTFRKKILRPRASDCC
jgi:hypothetical protein